MAIAAVPEYLGNDFKTASPGLRFGMYLQLWGVNQRSRQPLWTTHDITYEVRGPDKQEREVKNENKVPALRTAISLNNNNKVTMQALSARQQIAFATVDGANSLQLDAIAVAPFSTGLGNEHPLENGFAFLNPYGLPYLPGSGVKGVLRQAARELASGEWGESDWDEAAITTLFGLESKDGDSKQLRGTLTFWDVIPQIKGDSLSVEIMTPHQKHYYQDGQNPHDSGQPTPIPFLTVPPGSAFSFYVQCNQMLLQHLAPELAQNERWKILLGAAFEHAFNWLGFGAKTAVGYGAMQEDQKKKSEREEQHRQQQEAERLEREKAVRQQQISAMDPIDKAIAEFLDARSDKNQPEINALLAGLKANTWEGDLAKGVAQNLKERMRSEKKWRETSNKKNPQKDKDFVNTQCVMGYLK